MKDIIAIAATMHPNATPPITPPTIAPTFVWLECAVAVLVADVDDDDVVETGVDTDDALEMLVEVLGVCSVVSVFIFAQPSML